MLPRPLAHLEVLQFGGACAADRDAHFAGCFLAPQLRFLRSDLCKGDLDTVRIPAADPNLVHKLGSSFIIRRLIKLQVSPGDKFSGESDVLALACNTNAV